MTEFFYWYIKRPLGNLRLRFVWLLPSWLVYWCAIRLMAHATAGEYGNDCLDDVPMSEALKRWEKGAAK